MLQKSRKEEMVKDLAKAVEAAESLVFVSFKGLNVAEETKLRRDLREKGVTYKVSRKTLLHRALEGKAEGEMPALEVEVAVAFSKPAGADGDATGSAREVYNFQKTHQGILEIIGGIFGGKFIGKERAMELAMIPSREVLLSKFAFLLLSPMQRLAIAMSEVSKKK